MLLEYDDKSLTSSVAPSFLRVPGEASSGYFQVKPENGTNVQWAVRRKEYKGDSFDKDGPFISIIGAFSVRYTVRGQGR